jgi:hypothetical protein
MEIDQQLAAALKAIAASNPPAWVWPLRAYPGFNWARIGAHVTTSDRHGAAVVCWMGHQYTRRSGAGKFGAAIWFSRSVGDGDGAAQYLRLVTFKDSGAAVEPLNTDVLAKLGL